MRRLALFLCCFFVGFVNVSHAADPFVVRYLGIDQGLSNNEVTCIYQDYQGFMWFGSYDGLNRYDGYSFQIFRNVIGDSSSLSGNHIYTIAGDAFHRIWVGGLSGVSVYDPGKGRFRPVSYFPLAKNSPQTLTEEIHRIVRVGDTMMVASQAHGLIIFSGNKLTGKQIPLDGKTGTIANYSVTCICYDSVQQNIWVFVNGAGMCRYDVKKQRLQVVNADVQQAVCAWMRSNGEILVGTDNGLYTFNCLSKTFGPDWFHYWIKVNSIIEDKQHTIWIGSDGGGLLMLPAGATSPIPYQSDKDGGINSNAIYALYEDADGRKWVGTLRGGINILETKATSFRKISINTSRGGAGDFILSFCEDDKSDVWIGTDGAGLTRWNRAANTFSRYVYERNVNSISGNFITNMTEDYTHSLWVASWFNGLNRLDMATGQFKRYLCHNPVTGGDEYNVWVVFEDSHRRLWVSTTNDGHLYTYNRTTDRFDLFDNAINNFQVLAEDSAGDMWGGTYTSLVRLDTISKKHKIYKMGYPVRSIHEDRHHHFWVGTESGGLLLFDRQKGTYDRITTKDGLPNNTILRILEDRKGNLWLSTYNGLCKFDPVSRTCRNFSASDGLQSNQFSFNAALVLKSGEFLFGGIKGFNVFHPDSISDRKADLNLFLTGLRINNTPIQDDDSYVSRRDGNGIAQVSIPYDKAVISLDYSAPAYSDVDKLKYAYYLKGWDKDWNLVGNSRIANYAHLREGTYAFTVKIMNADGRWGEERTLLQIVVLPPWYRTWWTYSICLLLIALLIYTYLLYTKRQERLRYEIKLAHFESEKEKEIAEKRIAFFTHISHEFRTPLTLILNPLKELLSDEYPDPVHKKAGLIHRNARRLLSLVDQLLLFRKVESVDQQMRIGEFDLSETCREVFLSFHQHAAANQISFEYVKPDHRMLIYGDREKIEIILFNLLSNAFKYTPPHGKITLELIETEKKVQVLVADTGVGIAPDVGNKLFDVFYQADNAGKGSQTGFGIGLYVSRKLALAHKGDLQYQSEPGKGTQFRLCLLKGNRHLDVPKEASLPIEDLKGTRILQEPGGRS
ncbi:MAG: two-component regulator propeller domain-containing protein [Ilumatobacteraceae bacterium]